MLGTFLYNFFSAPLFSLKKCLFCCKYHRSSHKYFYSYDSIQLRLYQSCAYSEIQIEDLKEGIHEKIIYNSLLHKMGFLQRKRIEKHAKLKVSPISIPVSLKFIAGTDVEPSYKEQKNTVEVRGDYSLSLPYKVKSVKGNIFVDSSDKLIKISDGENDDLNERISDHPSQIVGNWMNDYEKYSSPDNSYEDELTLWNQDYGTPDRSLPVSEVPCGGCGALLHCQDSSIPGYLPSEIYRNCSNKDLREIVCQRCHFLKNFKTALSVSVDPKDYPRILSQIKDRKALVILVADVTDLPCSIWPGIVDIIGTTRPLFLVGNKIDLIPGDRKGWTQHVHSYLRSCLPKGASVNHTTLISAKTGFGVEELINKLHNFWQYKGDVYLVGCTNVGKSTLFNALLQSDYCKVKAVDLLQRATTAPWPGTTLNLLKFLDLLTTQEVTLTVPDKIIVPRTFALRVGLTLFIAGLVRMDYLKGSKNIKVTIFADSSLPVTIIKQEDAAEVYKALLGTKYMLVPQGPEERLQQWPGLELAKEVNLIGKHSQEACADVTLSSAGWVAIAPYATDIIKMSVWTPKGRGVHIRIPSLLPHSVSLRGKKIGKFPAYQPNRPFHET